MTYQIVSPSGVSHLIVRDGPCSTCGDSAVRHWACPVCGAGFRELCRGNEPSNLSHRERRLLHARKRNETEGT